MITATAPTSAVSLASLTSTHRSIGPDVALAAEKAGAAPSLGFDHISIETVAKLRAELERDPQVRADVVARARLLAADPSYPQMEALTSIAGQIMGAPDLSEDVS